jgi:hypothetical protein
MENVPDSIVDAVTLTIGLGLRYLRVDQFGIHNSKFLESCTFCLSFARSMVKWYIELLQ